MIKRCRTCKAVYQSKWTWGECRYDAPDRAENDLAVWPVIADPDAPDAWCMRWEPETPRDNTDSAVSYGGAGLTDAEWMAEQAADWRDDCSEAEMK